MSLLFESRSVGIRVCENAQIAGDERLFTFFIYDNSLDIHSSWEIYFTEYT
jgi:hypothetical protein